MTTTNPVWTENVALHGSSSVAAAASVTDDIDIATAEYDLIYGVVEIVFGGSPDGNVLVEIFGSSNSGSDDDTEPIAAFTIPLGTSATKRKSFPISGVPYIAVKVTNNDSTDAVTVESWYAGRKWSSA